MKQKKGVTTHKRFITLHLFPPHLYEKNSNYASLNPRVCVLVLDTSIAWKINLLVFRNEFESICISGILWRYDSGLSPRLTTSP